MSTRSPEWQEVEALLDVLLELTPETRAAFLAEAQISGEVRGAAERLLAHHERAERFLAEPAAEYAGPLIGNSLENEEPPTPAPAHAGPYRVVREVGHGGMGTVYLAERADGQFRQRVALKLVRGG